MGGLSGLARIGEDFYTIVHYFGEAVKRGFLARGRYEGRRTKDKGRRTKDEGRSEDHGMSHDQALQYLNHMVDSQAITIATNQVMATTAFCFAIAAFVIWLAPKPTRSVSMAEAGH